MQQPLVVLDCERMRHPNTGLFHFCWHLAATLPRYIPSGFRLGLYLPETVATSFDPELMVLPQRSWHKLLLPAARKARIWHSTYQDSNYIPVAANCKILLTVHDLNFLYDQRKSVAKKAKYLRRINANLKRADAIVAISEYVKQDLLRHTAADPARIRVIYNGCNINDRIEPTPPQQQPRAPFFFTIGTIVDKKNFHVLPGLLAGNSYQLVIAGIVQSEAYKNQVIAEAQALGVADRLVFTGAISEAEKYWYLQQCAAFAFPSLSEGFGLPVIEAMYFGKPVLLSRATSLPEIGGAHAYYFNSFEPAHMSALAQEAIDDVRLHQKEAAIRQWAGRFRWDEAAKAYVQLYQQLLGS